ARGWLCFRRRPWHDAVFRAWTSRAPPARILDRLPLDWGPPLFYFLEKPAAALADAWNLPDKALRFLPLAALGLLFFAGRSLPSSSRARFLLLAAASPLLLLYSV